MKKITAIFISMAILLCAVFAVPFTAGAEQPTDFCVKIVHTNDIHARVLENAKSGIIGVEKLAGIIDEYTVGADMSLVLDSGDTFHGQSIATLVKGESIAQLIKACGYDAMTAGNHDWSYGKDRLKELAKLADVTMLTGNVVDEKGERFFDDEFLIKEVTKDGQTLKIGIFGVIDPKIYTSTAPSNVEGLTFTNSADYANRAAAELKEEGCDIVIALSHTYNPEELAKQVNDVDLWLCGHEHVDIDTTATTPDGGTAYVIEDGYYLYEIGLIELDCTLGDSGEITALSCKKTAVDYTKASEYENSAELTKLLEDINAEQSVILNKVVGSSPAELDGVWEDLRIDETNLGRAVTAAYIKATGADVAFENAGGIRASVKSGEITYGDIISVSPYGNYIVTKQVTGKQLKEIIETSIDIQIQCIAANDSGDYDAWPQSSGSYLQTGGITVLYNPALEKGSRVISIKVGESPLDEEKLYTVATNNYVAVSQYYPQLAQADEAGEFCACDEALIEFFGQDSDTIAAVINKQGMVKTDKTSESEEESKDPDTSDIAEPGESESVVEPGESEVVSEPDSEGGTSEDVSDNPPSIGDSSGEPKAPTAPQTGYNANMTVIVTALAAAAAMAVTAVAAKKEREK